MHNTTELGDYFETILSKLGSRVIVRSVKKITGKDCGCAQRRERLNEWGRKLGIGGEPDAQKSPHSAG